MTFDIYRKCSFVKRTSTARSSGALMSPEIENQTLWLSCITGFRSKIRNRIINETTSIKIESFRSTY